MSGLSEADNRRLTALERKIEELTSRNPPSGNTTIPRGDRSAYLVYMAAHPFGRGDAVVLHSDGTWDLLTSSDADAVLWGIVSRTTTDTFTIITYGEAVVPHASLVVGGKYKFTAGAPAVTTDLSGVVATATETNHLFVGAGHGGGSAIPNPLIVGSSSVNGKIQVQGIAAGGDAIVLDASLVLAAGKVLIVREIDVCVAGVGMKMLVVGSAPY